DVFDAFLYQPGTHALHDVDGGAGVADVGGADLDGAGSGHEEFDGVVAGGDAAHADNGDVGMAVAQGAGDFLNHTQGDGHDGGAGEAAGAVAEDRFAGCNVYSEAGEGVDERDGVGSGIGSCDGDGAQVARVG